jgi:hypothetical protein
LLTSNLVYLYSQLLLYRAFATIYSLLAVLGVLSSRTLFVGEERLARRIEVPIARAKKVQSSSSKVHNITTTKKYRRKYTSCISTTPTIKTRLEAAFQIMTDVAAVVAAAAGNRGIGFQGKLVSYSYFLVHMMYLCT